MRVSKLENFEFRLKNFLLEQFDPKNSTDSKIITLGGVVRVIAIQKSEKLGWEGILCPRAIFSVLFFQNFFSANVFIVYES